MKQTGEDPETVAESYTGETAKPQDPGENNWDEASSLILQSAGEGIYGLDEEGLTTFVNPAAEAMTGWLAEELIGRSQHALLHHSHADKRPYPRHECPIYMALKDGRMHRADDEVFWRKDGTSFPVAYTSTPILRNGKPAGAVVLFQDVSERKRREAWEKSKNAVFLAITSHRSLRVTLGLLADAFRSLLPSLAMAIFERNGASLKLEADAGLPGELRARFSAGLLPGTFSACMQAAEKGVPVRIKRGIPVAAVGYEAEVEIAEGAFPACLSIPLLSGSGQVLGALAFLGEQSSLESGPAAEAVQSVCDLARIAIEHQTLHRELLRQSQHDHLTGLPNRLLLEDRLEQAIARARRHGTQVGVCYIDLDRFKQINDTLGHSVGDALLQHVAKILKRGLREVDTVARHGGDEFILVLPDLSGMGEAEEVCERLLGSLRQPVRLGKHTLAPAASIGLSLFPEMGDGAPALLRNADTALYAAKRGGKDRMHAYDAALGEELRKTTDLQNGLRTALERNELSLAYQPLYSAQKQLKGFEALLRWTRPEGVTVSPEQFIPIAEETGLIVSIGEWVLAQACRQVVEWNGDAGAAIRMAVNVSAVQLDREDFPDRVARILAESGLAPNLLELEVTETWVIADPKQACKRLERLRALGVGISIDDFGVGHSAFSCLQQLPVDTLKIDRSFIGRLDGSPTGSAIVRTIVALAEELGLQTVAEGVETGEQMEELKKARCGLLQGFLLARPLGASAAGMLIERVSG